MSQTQSTKLQPIPRQLVNIAWILVLGSMAPMLDSTMVNIALHQLSASLHTNLGMVQWAVTGFMLAMGAAVPFSGWLANRFSGKSVYMWAQVAFAITSLLSGLAWNVNVLIAFRILQGLASGLIITLLFTLLVDAVGGDKMGRVMAIVGVPMTLGPMLGPIIGGLIVQYVSWRVIFFINVPVAVLAIGMLLAKVPATPAKNPTARFDWLGTLMLAAISGTIVYGVVQASVTGSFTNTVSLAYFAGGIFLVATYIWHALRNPQTVVLPLRLFKHRNFTGSMIGIFLSGFVTSGPMLLLPLFFQDVRGQSAVIAAVSLIPQSIGILVSRRAVGELIDSIGARWVVIVGVAVSVAATLPFVYFNQNSNYLLIAIVMFVRGVGGAAVKSATQADAYRGIDRSDSAAASLSSNMFQQVGSGFATALLATVVAGYIAHHHIATAVQLGAAYQQGFLWCSILVLMTLLPAWLLTSRVRRTSVVNE